MSRNLPWLPHAASLGVTAREHRALALTAARVTAARITYATEGGRW